MTILVASTIPGYVLDQEETWGAWLYNAALLRECSPVEVKFFAALEHDELRGKDAFEPVTKQLAELGGEWWFFSFDDGAEVVTANNRLRRITLGQNLASQYATDLGASHLLFLGADLEPCADAIPKLLEMQWPIVGGEVPTYCLSGQAVSRHPETGQMFGFPVEQHMATTSFVMIDREILSGVRWRYDVPGGLSDDPCLYQDAKRLGYPTLVRKDCVARHHPLQLPPVEQRGHDLRLKK